MSVLSLFTIAILATSAVSPVYFQPQNASAQAATASIITSADSHGDAFFGEGIVQVVINDPDADDDDVQEDITVEIDADPETGAGVSGSFTVFETSDSSGRFEFFLAHADASVNATDIDAINTNGAEEHESVTDEASIIRFGAGEELPVTTDLFEDVSFDITVGDEEITVDYEESSAELTLDRSTYGSDSLIHMFITDQDANKDPTNVDGFAVTEVDLNTRMFDLEDASFVGAATFRETGDNTAIFEAVLQLAGVGSPSSLVGEELVYSEESVQITLNDLANYLDPSAPENDSLDTSSRSFDIDDEDGHLDEVATLTFSSELRLTLRDNDQNRDSDDDETLDGAVLVALDSIGGDVEFLDMEETDDNTGIFVIDLANNELPVTFLADGQAPVFNNSRLELRQSDINDDILIEYNDPRDDDSENTVTSSMTLEITLVRGVVDIPAAAGVDESFVMTITDADLNDNPRTKDTYTFVLNDHSPYELRRAGQPIGDLAWLEFGIENDELDFGAESIAYALVETDINSGVFTTTVEMQDILDFGESGNPKDVDDGDILEISYDDFMSIPSIESTDDLTITEEDDNEVPPDNGGGGGGEENTCMGQKATIVGTEGSDTLNGTSGPDVIVGLRGNDVINGLGGDDIICGGLGMDQLNGGEGADKLLGGNENDAIDGGTGNDMLWGGTGWDRLSGGAGNDAIRGGIGNDRLSGGDGNDSLFGQEGVDRLDGGAGSNTLIQG